MDGLRGRERDLLVLRLKALKAAHNGVELNGGLSDISDIVLGGAQILGHLISVVDHAAHESRLGE